MAGIVDLLSAGEWAGPSSAATMSGRPGGGATIVPRALQGLKSCD
jgi:hypothetical protein